MNDHSYPFNLDLGNRICPKLTEYLVKNFPEITVLNCKEFAEKRGYEPCVSSIFNVAEGGSFDFEIDGKEVVIHNGTLSHFTRPKDSMPFYQFNQIYEKLAFG